MQSDGKVLIGGGFTTVNGVSRAKIARLHADGSLDPTFNPDDAIENCADCSVRISSVALERDGSVQVQPDGKILLAGAFYDASGNYRTFVRLNPDGSRDGSFVAPEDIRLVYSMAIQPDAKILVAGGASLARLNPDGSRDTSFAPWSPSVVYSIALQADGKLLIVGNFSGGIARLNPNGSRDLTFSANLRTCSNCYPGSVQQMVLQPDGKVLYAGQTSETNGLVHAIFGRLNVDGYVSSVALQPGGKILIGGHFSSVGGIARNGIARLNPDGSLDTSFDAGAGPYYSSENQLNENEYTGTIYTVKLQPDGKLLVGGMWHTFNGVIRLGLVRLNADPSVKLYPSGGIANNEFRFKLVSLPGRSFLLLDPSVSGCLSPGS